MDELNRDSDPEAFKVKGDDVKVGDILFLPEGAEAYDEFGGKIDEELKKHYIAVADVLPGNVIWFFLVSVYYIACSC